MWIKDYEFYGINITRARMNSDQAVLNLDADEDEAKKKLMELTEGTELHAKLGEMFYGQGKSITASAYGLFGNAHYCYYSVLYPENEDDPWPYSFAIAVILSQYVSEKLGINAYPEWSSLGDGDEVYDQWDESFREKHDLDEEFFIAVGSSLPWEKHTHAEQDTVDSLLKKAVHALACEDITQDMLKCGLQEAWHED